jgi:hypothetical protein
LISYYVSPRRHNAAHTTDGSSQSFTLSYADWFTHVATAGDDILTTVPFPLTTIAPGSPGAIALATQSLFLSPPSKTIDDLTPAELQIAPGRHSGAMFWNDAQSAVPLCRLKEVACPEK